MPQDSATGADGKVRTARPIALENGEARVRGIVTYPGGDRVDWRKLELPKDQAGTLSLRLTWKTPRPGLAVGLDVFDEYGRQVSAGRGGNTTTRRSRKTEVKNAKGTYLIRVYAPFRGDAGAYTLRLAFAPGIDGGLAGFPPPDMVIPDPPRLPQVPDAPVPCDATNYKTTPGCGSYCPDPPDVQWKGCSNVCPQVPDIAIKACWATMPCPTPADKRVKACGGQVPVCAAGAPVTTQCMPPPPLKPVRGKIENISQVGSKVEIRIDRGLNKGIDKGWLGRLLDSHGRPVPMGDFVVTKVSDKSSWGQVDLTSDQVTGKTVELRPPTP